ncbi:helix-turn-helix transcriptional regulator [Nocardia sp. NBC_00565]|uniref:helix-turn-helix domain-containing protein n=1 Tax=Nocardia sp. NBC_00565 TaxID=2975993 RepID=UPI002E81CB34|nr:helix-turn-helix transcriptional regulator [Nocardia sp. NBC_00565]WUC04076.1 helix-turn-helix transcriptional regulator [Nocardia sp. NBC_00565]
MIFSKWTRVEVLALRIDALRLTQEQFAEDLGFRQPTIRKWERATPERPVRGASAQALDTALARLDQVQLARFEVAVTGARLIDGVGGVSLSEFDRLDTGTPEFTHHAAEHGAEEDNDMKRRQLFVAGTAAGLTVLAHPRLPAHIGMSDAQRLAKRVDSFVTTEQKVGGGALAQLARTDLEDAKAVLATCDIDSAAAPLFISAAGNMAVTAGWLHYDNDDQVAARDCYRDAMALANETDDDELAAHTCLNVALQTVTQARRGEAHPTSALRSTLRAADLTRRQPSGRIHALIAARQATAYACLGDRSAFTRAVATAWREMDLAYDHEPFDKCADWLKFMCHNEVRYHEACGYKYLGEASRAAELFEQVAAERAGQRNSANYRAWLASSLAEVGNIDDAIAVAADVLENLGGGVSSGRTLRVLEPVRAAAIKPRHNDFQQRYDRFTTHN